MNRRYFVKKKIDTKPVVSAAGEDSTTALLIREYLKGVLGHVPEVSAETLCAISRFE